MIRLLESGKNVVTPVGWIYPFRSHDVAAVEAACRAGDATLHGTGINPGGITEQIPLLLSAFCKDIRHVRAEEFSDIRTYDTEFIVRDVMLFGKTPEEARASPMLAILGDGFGQSIDMVADALGVTLDPEKRTTHEMAVTTVDLDTPVGVIETGTVAAQRFTWEGLIDGEPFMTVRVNWLMGEERPRPGVDLRARGRALRGRVRRRAAAAGQLPRDAPADGRGRRPRPQRGHPGHRHALRERGPLRRGGRTRHPHLPRPAADAGPGRRRPSHGNRAAPEVSQRVLSRDRHKGGPYGPPSAPSEPVQVVRRHRAPRSSARVSVARAAA